MKLTTLLVTATLAFLTACGSSTPKPPVAPTITSFTVTANLKADGTYSVPYGTAIPMAWTYTGDAATSVTVDGDTTIAASATSWTLPFVRNVEKVTLKVTNAAGFDSKTVTISNVGVDLYTSYWWMASDNQSIAGPDASGNYFVAGAFNSGVLSKVDTSGNVSTIVAAPFTDALAINPTNGKLYIVLSHGIYTVDAAGNKLLWKAGSYGRIAISQSGNLYACGFFGDDRVYKITPALVQTTIGVRAQGIYGPAGIAVDANENVYVSNLTYDIKTVTINGITGIVPDPANTISKIAADGTVTTIAGVLQAVGYQDGPADQAQFAAVRGLALIGNSLYICDGDNCLIRKLDLSTMTVSSIAGTRYTSTLNNNQIQAPGKLGNGNAAIGIPMAITATSEGNLLVTTAMSPVGVAPSPDWTNAWGHLYQITLQ